jgi:hypothetical protein
VIPVAAPVWLKTISLATFVPFPAPNWIDAHPETEAPFHSLPHDKFSFGPDAPVLDVAAVRLDHEKAPASAEVNPNVVVNPDIASGRLPIGLARLLQTAPESAAYDGNGMIG